MKWENSSFCGMKCSELIHHESVCFSCSIKESDKNADIIKSKVYSNVFSQSAMKTVKMSRGQRAIENSEQNFITWLWCVFFVVYPDGRVCISILHAPGDDPMGYESSAERWSPVQSVEKILLSVVSMLAGQSPFT